MPTIISTFFKQRIIINERINRAHINIINILDNEKIKVNIVKDINSMFNNINCIEHRKFDGKISKKSEFQLKSQLNNL
jgi:hypothetical protein